MVRATEGDKMIINKISFDDSHRTNGTSLKGYIPGTTREQLEKVFGSPEEYGEGDKVTTEWMFTIDGEVGTIYDWKRYEDGAPEFDERYDWHVGGHGEGIVKLVLDALAQSGKRMEESNA
jgi:hypothetical protein